MDVPFFILVEFAPIASPERVHLNFFNLFIGLRPAGVVIGFSSSNEVVIQRLETEI